MDLRRTIIIIMFLSCVTNVIGIVHCHLNYPTYSAVSIYEMSYSIIFPICNRKKNALKMKKEMFVFVFSIMSNKFSSNRTILNYRWNSCSIKSSSNCLRISCNYGSFSFWYRCSRYCQSIAC